jgi:hypothetical protein
MANIPNSSRYRTAGRRTPSQFTTVSGGASWPSYHTAGSAGGARHSGTGNDLKHSGGGNWIWVIVFLALLIAFPVRTLSVLALLAFATWFLTKK